MVIPGVRSAPFFSNILTTFSLSMFAAHENGVHPYSPLASRSTLLFPIGTGQSVHGQMIYLLMLLGIKAGFHHCYFLSKGQVLPLKAA